MNGECARNQFRQLKFLFQRSTDRLNFFIHKRLTQVVHAGIKRLANTINNISIEIVVSVRGFFETDMVNYDRGKDMTPGNFRNQNKTFFHRPFEFLFRF